MKVLFIAGTLAKGGAEKQLFYLSRLLKKNNHEVKVISLTTNEYFEFELKKINVEVHYVGYSNNKIKRLVSIYKVCKFFTPDLIYGFHFYTGIYAGIVGRILNTLSIGSIRSNGYSEKAANGFLSWFHFFLPNIIIANSLNGIQNVEKIFFKKKIFYLPNIIDLDYFKFKAKLKSDSINLLFIGSLQEIKQPNIFIELVDLLLHNDKKVTAKIIGVGPLEYKLKSSVNNNCVEFLGNIDDVRPFLYGTDFLISTSLFEGTPNVMLEAYSTGTPVFAIYHDQLQYWVDKGLMLKTKDIFEVKEQILKKPIFDLVANRSIIENEHSEHIILNQFYKILFQNLK